MKEIFKKIAKILAAWLLRPFYRKIINYEFSGYSWRRRPFFINLYMQSRFKYLSDEQAFQKKEHPQTAREIFEHEYGDCEDWAEFARTILPPYYCPHFYYIEGLVEGKLTAHVVCRYIDAVDKYGYIDTGGRFEGIDQKEFAEIVWENTYKNSVDLLRRCGIAKYNFIEDHWEIEEE